MRYCPPEVKVASFKLSGPSFFLDIASFELGDVSAQVTVLSAKAQGLSFELQ